MNMPLLNDETVLQIKQLFDNELVDPVDLLFFTGGENCKSCEPTQQLLEEISLISGKLRLTIFNIHENADISRKYDIQLTPGLVIAGRDGENLVDYGIRFTGIPSGYEFSSLIQDIILVSKHDSGKSDRSHVVL